MSERFAIVGDIHGAADRLARLTRKIEGRRLVFVGDYINRGHDARRTLDQLIAISENSPATVFLLGNHEESFLAYIGGTLSFFKFAGMGGLATLKSYLPRASRDVRDEFLEVFPRKHRRFLEDCSDYFETAEMIVSHCGIDPSNPDSRSRADMVIKGHDELFSEHFHSPKLVISGHYSQASGSPYVRNNFVCLDTGGGTAGGPLTALLLPERTFIQQ